MKNYISPHTTTVLIEASNIICASVTTIVPGTGPIKKLGEIYIDIKEAL